jgi:hypothetical protein
MQTILKPYCAGMVFLAAFTAHAQSITYSNNLTVNGGNPPAAVAFSLPQFNPADGTLDSITLTMFSSYQFLFTYNGASAAGQLVFTQSNSLSFLYNGADVLAQKNFNSARFTATLPSSGQASLPPSALTLQGESIFSNASDLANFTGPGDIPLSAEYFDLPSVTYTEGSVTWSLDSSATMTAVVSYDFEAIPEPGITTMTILGGVALALVNRRSMNPRCGAAHRTRRACQPACPLIAGASPANEDGSWENCC